MLTTALCGLIIVFSYYIIRNAHIDATAEDLANLATALKADITPLVAGKDLSKLDAFTKSLGKETHVRITVIAPDGLVLADSEKAPATMENHRDRTEFAQALERNTGKYLRFSDTLKQEMLYIAVPVEKENKVNYVLRVSRFLKEINTTTNRLVEKILVVAIIIDMVALLFALIFSRGIAQPVRKLSAALQRAAKQNFSTRVFLRSDDEFKELADSFNFMIARLDQLFTELSRQKEELDSIISSLQEGLLVLDKEERILIANASIRHIVNENLEEGRFYWEVLREPKVNELVKRARNTGQNSAEEIELNGRIFLCNVTILGHNGEVTIVFHDITEIRKVERIKTDFVMNVSHELRTPLTSIKGFLETVETATLSDENRHYIDIIKRNTDRLINTISDLLALSELEEKGSKLELEPVNLENLIEQTIKIFEPQIKAKGFSLSVSSDPTLPPVKGDPFKLQQVIINLIDNAVKYTEKGGLSITINHMDGEISIVLEDTGPGIPSEHLSRIFERFYVVDKSRSKKLGGTGLGLSIVKHIVLLHNGRINIESVPGKGTKCTIVLPVYDT